MATVDELFAIGSLLSGQDREIQRTVREYVAKHVRPHIADWFAQGSFPVRDMAPSLGELGLLGMHLTGYGCAGTSATAYGLACLELEAADSGLRSLVSVQGSLAMTAIHKHGSEEQKQQWLPGMAAGQLIGCFGLTEADYGSDPGGMRTQAVRAGTGWVLNGSKMWITNGTVADVAIIWAQTVDKIAGFIVPTSTPGFSAVAVPRKLSLRASDTAEISLTDVRVPASAQLPHARGLSGPLACLDEARFGIIFGAIGAARDCLDATLAYTGDRTVFGKSLTSYQLTQAKIADMALELGKAQLLALQLAAVKDRGALIAGQISLGKLNSTRTALAIARECRTLLGASGITLDYPVLRHANNLESVLTYEGTAEVHQLVIGQALTGVSAFR